ncbi:MAG: serine/threonine protein kinase [Pirellulaceae bacterium]|nr:MAG: serine/threonine protein kinase [Pirellulaceae bacterium]
MVRLSSLGLIVMLLGVGHRCSLHAQERWPGFLGPVAAHVTADGLPLRWSPEQGVAWVRPLTGHGQSSPVVWDERAWVTSVEGPQKDRYYVHCVHIRDGQVAWSFDFPNSHPQKNSYYVSRAAPTPIVDEERVVAFFESGDLVALTHDGDLLWQRDVTEEIGPIQAEFGIGASPCQTADTVYLLIEHELSGWLMAIDKASGSTRWKVPRAPAQSWSSPAVVQVGTEQYLVVSSSGPVKGYDPDSGAELWSVDDIGGNTGCSPIDFGHGRFLVGASPGRDGKHATLAEKSNCLIQISPQDGSHASKRWFAKGAYPSWASPILHRGLAYWLNRAGVLFAFDAETGEQVFAERTPQSCWATPLGIGDRVYLLGKDGLVTVVQAGREYQVLAENVTWNEQTLPPEQPLEEEDPQRQRTSAMFSKPTLYGYAVTSDAFLVRVGNALICCRSQPTTNPQ